MNDLLFHRPMHRLGLNLTVRLGTKWLGESYATVQGMGPRRLRTMSMKFSDISPSVLKLEHDEKCRNVDGLKSTMVHAYGDKFSESSIVTLVFYHSDEEVYPI